MHAPPLRRMRATNVRTHATHPAPAAGPALVRSVRRRPLGAAAARPPAQRTRRRRPRPCPDRVPQPARPDPWDRGAGPDVERGPAGRGPTREGAGHRRCHRVRVRGPARRAAGGVRRLPGVDHVVPGPRHERQGRDAEHSNCVRPEEGRLLHTRRRAAQDSRRGRRLRPHRPHGATDHLRPAAPGRGLRHHPTRGTGGLPGRQRRRRLGTDPLCAAPPRLRSRPRRALRHGDVLLPSGRDGLAGRPADGPHCAGSHARTGR